MGLGSLLVGGRILFLDHSPVAAGISAYERFTRRSQATSFHHTLVDLFFWRDVGLWRTDLWLDDALPGHVSRHGGCPGVLRRVRNSNSADLQIVHDHDSGRAKHLGDC